MFWLIKKEIKVNLVFNIIYKFRDNKFSVTDINNIKTKSQICFWNKNTNKSDLNIKKNRNNNKNKNEKMKN